MKRIGSGKKYWGKYLSLFLTVAMLVSMLPVNVLAEALVTPAPTSVETATASPTDNVPTEVPETENESTASPTEEAPVQTEEAPVITDEPSAETEKPEQTPESDEENTPSEPEESEKGSRFAARATSTSEIFLSYPALGSNTDGFIVPKTRYCDAAGCSDQGNYIGARISTSGSNAISYRDTGNYYAFYPTGTGSTTVTVSYVPGCGNEAHGYVDYYYVVTRTPQYIEDAYAVYDQYNALAIGLQDLEIDAGSYVQVPVNFSGAGNQIAVTPSKPDEIKATFIANGGNYSYINVYASPDAVTDSKSKITVMYNGLTLTMNVTIRNGGTNSTSIRFQDTNKTIDLNGTTPVSVDAPLVILGDNTTGFTVSSSDDAVVTAGYNLGVVSLTAHKIGYAVITVTKGDLKAQLPVTVMDSTSVVEPTRLAFTTDTINVENGSVSNVQLTMDGSANGLTVATSDPKVATASVNLNNQIVTVEAKGEGTATITASINGLTATLTVLVTDSGLTSGIQFASDMMAMDLDGKASLTRNMALLVTGDKTGITVTSSNTDVALVAYDTANGTVAVTAKKPGVAIITAAKGDLRAQMTVAVSDSVAEADPGYTLTSLNWIDLDVAGTPKMIDWAVESQRNNFVLGYYLNELANRDNVVVSISSSDTSVAAATIASVDGAPAKDGEVTIVPKGVGTATIVLTAREGDRKLQQAFQIVIYDSSENVQNGPTNITFKSSTLEYDLATSAGNQTTNVTIAPADSFVNAVDGKFVVTTSNGAVVANPQIVNANTIQYRVVGVGTAVITYMSTVNGVYGQQTITVVDSNTPVVPESISLNEEFVQIDMNSTLNATVPYVILPTNANAQMDVTASTSNASVVEAQIQSGKLVLTAQGKGSATVTVTTKNGKKSMLFVTVIPEVEPSTEMVYFNTTEYVFQVNSTEDFTNGPKVSVGYNAYPANLSDISLTNGVAFTSSNPNVVTVTQDSTGNGVPLKSATLKATGVGSAIVTATFANGMTAAMKVQVNQSTAEDEGRLPSDISFDVPAQINIMKDSTKNLGYTVLSTAYAGAVEVSSSDTNIVSVDTSSNTNRTVVITANEVGTAEITIKTENGLTDVVTVTVLDNYIAATNIVASTDEVTLNISAGNKNPQTNVWVRCVPQNTNDQLNEIVSSDESVATIAFNNNNGQMIITGHKAGTAIIHVASLDGLTKDIKVTVVESVTTAILPNAKDVVLTLNSRGALISNNQILGFRLYPSTQTDVDADDVTVVSQDPATVSVVNNGGSAITLTPNKAGSTVITLTTPTGIKETVNVIVKQLTVEEEVQFPTEILFDVAEITMPVRSNREVGFVVNPFYSIFNANIAVTSTDSTVANGMVGNGFVSIVSGDNPGTTMVTVKTVNNLTATIKVNVVTDYVESTSVMFDTDEVVMQYDPTVGVTRQAVGFTLIPLATNDRVAKIVSSDDSVVMVESCQNDVNGTISLAAYKPGTATIMLTTVDGKRAQLVVKVADISKEPTRIAFTPESANINLSADQNLSKMFLLNVFPVDNNWNNNIVLTVVDDDNNIIENITQPNFVAAAANNNAVATFVVTFAQHANGSAKIVATATNGVVAQMPITVTTKEGILTVDTDVVKNMNVEDELTLSYEVMPDTDAAKASIVWTSTNEAVATVVAGVVKANAVGQTTIKGTAPNGTYVEWIIVVRQPAKQIVIDATNAETLSGVGIQINATLAPAGADGTLVYTIVAPAAVTADQAVIYQNGWFVAKEAGTYTIEVSAINTGAAADPEAKQIVVEVTDRPYNTIVLSEMSVGRSESMSIDLNADKPAYDPNVHGIIVGSWTSNNVEIATVNNGVVEGVKAGITNLYATTDNGYTLYKQVRVTNPEVIGFVAEDSTIALKVGEYGYAGYRFEPADADTSEWTVKVATTNNDNVIALDTTNPLIFRAINSGEAIITYTAYKNYDPDNNTYDRMLTSYTRVIVEKSLSSLDYIDEQKDITERISYLYVGESIDFPFVVTPETQEAISSLKWTSDNTDVMTVDGSNGYALSAGHAYITATAEDGTQLKWLVVVWQPTIGIDLETKNLTTQTNIGVQVKATALPVDSIGKLTYTIKDANADSAISSEGWFVASKPGTYVVEIGAQPVVFDETNTNLGNVVSPSGGLEPVDTVECVILVEDINDNAVILGAETIDMYDSLAIDVETYKTDADEKIYDANTHGIVGEWVSTDASIATVNNGVVYGAKAGTAYVYAATDNGYTLYVKVTVNKEPVTGIKLDNEVLNLHVGDVVSTGYKLLPEGADTSNVRVFTDNTDDAVATYENGVVTANAAGKTVVTFVVIPNDFKGDIGDINTLLYAQMTINVDNTLIDIEYVDNDPRLMQMEVGDIQNIEVLSIPDNAAAKSQIIWTSDDETIATVQSGKVVARSAGTTYVHAKVENGTELTWVVVVTQPATGVINVPAKLSTNTYLPILIPADIYPANAEGSLVFEIQSQNPASEDGTVDALVLGNGYFMATKAGMYEVKVTATVANTPVASAICVVEVKDEPNYNIELDDVYLEVGDQHVVDIKNNAQYSEAKHGVVRKVYTMNESVVAVNEESIAAVKAGQAYVYMETSLGYRFYFKVTVSDILSTLNVNPESMDLTVNDVALINASIAPVNNYTTLSYQAENDEVVSVNDAGVVTALKAGKTFVVVTAVYNNTDAGSAPITLTKNVVITVKQPATSVDLTDDQLNMLVDEKIQLAVKVLPEDATDKTLTWTSSDETIATVDNAGNVMGIAPGVVTITAKTADGAFDTVNITVIRKASGITLSKNLIKLYPGESTDLTYTISHDDAQIDRVEITFDGAHQDVLTWNNGILFTKNDAKAIGSATVTATLYGTAYEGGVLKPDVELASDSCTVEFLVPTNTVEIADLNGTAYADDEVIKNHVGESLIVKANVNPDNASDTSVTWATTDSTVAKVEPINGFGAYAKITFVGKGTTELALKSEQSGVTDTIAIEVVNQLIDFTVDPTDKALYPGEGFQINVTLNPEDTLINDKVTFTSDNDSSITVDKYGLVKAVKPGVANITVTYNNGIESFERVVAVTVKTPVDKLSFVDEDGAEITEHTMWVGNTKDLYKMLKFASNYDDADGQGNKLDPSDKSVTWVSEYPSIVSVDENGVARANAVGNVWVTAIAHNGVKAKINITVLKNSDELILDAYNVELWVGETGSVTASLNPADATDTIALTVADTDGVIEVINNSGKTITFKGLKAGRAEITATCTDPKDVTKTLTKKCIVTVKQSATAVKVDSVKPVAVGTDYPKTVTASYLGQVIYLTATVEPETAYDKSVKWSIVGDEIVTIDENTGRMVANTVGTTIVKATSVSNPDVYGYIYVKVIKNQIQFTLDPIEQSIYPQDTFTVYPVLKPDDTVMPAEENILFAIKEQKLNGPAILEGSTDVISIRKYTDPKTGEVYAKVVGINPGTAIIESTIYPDTEMEMVATCEVTVMRKADTLSVKKDKIMMLVGEKYRYDYAPNLIFNNDDADRQPDDKTVTYTVRDTSVATVDAWGQITAHKVGTTIIDIVSNANPKLRAQVLVEVVDLALGITADAAEIRVYPGQKIPVDFTFVPEQIATDKIEWSYTDNLGNPVANGFETAYYRDGHIYTLKAGYVEMIATVKIPQEIIDLYGEGIAPVASTKILVTVLKPVTDVNIVSVYGENYEGDGKVKTGDKLVLFAEATPDDAYDAEIYWTSSDPNIASVDAFGVVTFHKVGNVTIYATSRYSGAQDSQTFNVELGAQDYQKKYGVTTVSRLHIRKAPSLSAPYYTKYSKGVKVLIVGEVGSWYEIQFSGYGNTTGTAFVHKYYVRVTGYVDNNTDTDTDIDAIYMKSNAKIANCVTTNVTQNAGSGHYTVVPAGTRILVLASSGSYYKISYGDRNMVVGYVLKSKVQTDIGFVYGEGSYDKYVPNAGGGYTSYPIEPGSGSSSNTDGTTQKISIPAVVKISSAPVYSGFAPADRLIIGRVYQGAVVTVTSEKLNGYYQVAISTGTVGWVSADALTLQTATVEEQITVTKHYGTTTASVNLRSGASTSYKRLATLRKGTKVSILSTELINGFYKVKASNGTVGYMSAKYLKVSTVNETETVLVPIQETKGRVNGCNILNVREYGSMGSTIVNTLRIGDIVKIIADIDDWYHIELSDGSWGFVQKAYIYEIK